MSDTLTFHPVILECEKFWIRLQPEFESLGYDFRPRFRPGWTPSWSGDSDTFLHEDANMLRHPQVIDAVRRSDGARVMIKRIVSAKGSQEAMLTHILGTEPGSPIVPVFEKLILQSRPDLVFLVLKELIPWDTRSFKRVDEALHFVKEMLWSLAYLHECHISHGDIASSNIMMDGLCLYDYEPHPHMTMFRYAEYGVECLLKGDVPVYPKYYLIDCGLSLFHRPPGRVLIQGPFGQDTSPPEFARSEWNDPIKVDLWTMGRFLRVYVVDEYMLDMLRPLIAALQESDPNDRMPAGHALEFFKELVADLTPEQLAAPTKCDPNYSIYRVELNAGNF